MDCEAIAYALWGIANGLKCEEVPISSRRDISTVAHWQVRMGGSLLWQSLLQNKAQLICSMLDRLC